MSVAPTYVEDGEIKFGPLEEGFKEYITLIHDSILGKGASFQLAVCPDPFLTVPQLQANGSVGEVGIHSFEKGNLGFQLLRESGLKLLGAFHCGRCFVNGSASQVDRYFSHW